MLHVAPVLDRHRVDIPEADRRVMADDVDLRKRVNVVRSTIPAVTHVDYSARVQTVDRERNPLFHSLISAFHELTGVPVVVNTSYNIRGEPIVCSPGDAYRCFAGTEIDTLVLGRYMIHKTDLAEQDRVEDRGAYLKQFELD